MPKFPSKVKIINIKVKVIMDFEGAFWDLEGALLYSLRKSEFPGSYVPAKFCCVITKDFLVLVEEISTR